MIGLGNSLEMQLSNLIWENADANFFCDETPFGQTGLSTNFLIWASGKIQQQCFFWLACHHKTTNVKYIPGNLFHQMLINTTKNTLKLICSHAQNFSLKVNLKFSFVSSLIYPRD